MSSNNRKIIDILRILLPIFIINSLFISSSFLIPIIDLNKSFVPCFLEYVRTFILATTSSIIIQLGSKKYQYIYHSKPSVEFLALLLLAYPQKTEIDQTYSEWNLVKRECYLFGAIYNLVSEIIKSYPEIRDIIQSDAQPNEAILRQRSEENINQLTRQRSTLDNCIQVRRNSHSLKKNVYSYPPEDSLSNNGYQDSVNESYRRPSETNQDTLIIEYRSDSIEFLNPNQSFIEGNKTPLGALTPNHSHYGSIGSIQSINLNDSSAKDFLWQAIGWRLTWSISSSLYEIGTSLIISITFIYVPDLNDDYFSWLEIYFYNNIYLFLLEIVLPVSIMSSVVHQLELKSASYEVSQIKLALFLYPTVSVALYIFGFVNT